MGIFQAVFQPALLITQLEYLWAKENGVGSGWTEMHMFTRANSDYCQDFLNYMSNVDPFTLKFSDENGVSLHDCNKRCGNSPVNSGCVELARHLKSPNTTLDFLAGLEGVTGNIQTFWLTGLLWQQKLPLFFQHFLQDLWMLFAV